jgi:hypothetical protein
LSRGLLVCANRQSFVPVWLEGSSVAAVKLFHLRKVLFRKAV